MRYDTARLADFSVLRSEEKKNGADQIFLILVLILLVFGVIMVLSASFPRASYDPAHVTGGNAAYYFIRQLIFAAAGVGAMLLCSRFPMGFYRRYARHFMALTLLLLALVPFIGVKANGSRRWLGVGSLTLQPSELAKLAVILLFAAMICKRRGRMRSFREGILPFALILAVIVGLLVLEPHFSASIIILSIGAVMIFLGGAPLGWFAAAFGAAGAALGVTSTLVDEALIHANDIAVFTAMCMCWSGYLSTHTSMMDSLNCKELIGKAILCHTVGGLCAGVAAHWFFELFSAIL